MARRRQNVSTTWYVVGTVAGLTALGGLTYVVVRRRPRAKAEIKTEGGCPPDGDWVGGALTTWPYPAVFRDESGFGEALESFGYDVGEWSSPAWHVCGLPMQDAVLQFTRDYNAVVVFVDDPPVDRLEIFSLIREPTVTAMRYVDRLQREAGYSWPILVEDARRANQEEKS